jgi:hypothetical protein
MEKFLNSIAVQLTNLGKGDFKRTQDSITVPASGERGFSVTVWGDQRGEFVVNYGHYWHGHFTSEEEAVNWFVAGVTGLARLICTYHWRYLVKAQVERKEDEGWVLADTNGSCLAIFVWWLPKRIEVFVNHTSELEDTTQ